ncbi:Aerobic cobaltochelatase subunit CobN [BD1-7 clade bacterium]|uniref:Cobaltochelatase subunit CobN n=1 Tax=BD1-7 clade bacterium TaxID=2029982 RepID=A0A5S9QV19_9GAMM|nr:Aerobic cobaltochelatase subunit CobN [BD1-7 clade bacterium]
MHLLAAQPGGFVDDEGIIDLEQSPADIVILSAADSTLAALSDAVSRLPEGYPSVRLANWMQLLKPAAYDLYEHKVLEKAKLIIVSLLGGKSYWQYGYDQLVTLAARNDVQLVVVPGDDAEDDELLNAGTLSVESSWRIWRYLRESGEGNMRELFRCIASDCFGQPDEYREPASLPQAMIYSPTQAMPTASDVMNKWQREFPSAILLFYRSHLQSGNTRVFDQLIDIFTDAGVNLMPVAVTSLKDETSIELINQLIEKTDARLLINTTGFASNARGNPQLSSVPSDFNNAFAGDLPVFQLLLSGSTEDDWQTHTQGLRSRDIAMQVVLPEMDGRIITRAVSFKAESYFDQRCEVSVVRYHLHHERAVFVAKLAQRWSNLAKKPNIEKRVALMLANYPTKDGRIGNGVGLDTPASALNLLTAMKANGYPIDALPQNGNGLIEELMGAVTNNPETLHARQCWQSMSLDDYQRCFSRLPADCQNAVIERWGDPTLDPKCRNGRLMIAGIRLGETFVGIQPARGFNLDLAANYHDPDLVPPHSYLACYFWLRDVYQVDAIVHVGKHGNLEWLPGKGLALSASCWPDIALGPMPHFYPFIVNDPGEGAQAKRRAQAVIIDHLMPPMARAETYGALAELEELVDECYQAMGMDTRREEWLRSQIVNKLRETHLIEELGLPVTADQDEDALLAELDAYLCDIKEAQIRHGLHIMGELPGNGMTETLVALLRLPRGEKATEQGILHNLAHDLALVNACDNELGADLENVFDPLSADASPWLGNKPALLAVQTTQPWRTAADTRERLELLAIDLINRYVVSVAGSEAESDVDELSDRLFQNIDAQHSSLAQTQVLLAYARDVIWPALQTSITQEIQALIDGLGGAFTAPGPSGAPTRGRLDTLPTGRNFYSVDNRAIPSKAAWALGQVSAQALIERHLQDHGDYPRQLGLSVWGTATMRTGGDDIAQAFALMGIKPLWADGSQRVVDFEIIPAMQLGRPRVDVTLRVSGFFRDAFPNVMKLYDAAVVALANFDEPGNGNTIRQHIDERVVALVAGGMAEEAARRSASYRVFGSKPGAYGAGLQGLIDERCWNERDDLTEAYLNWGGYAYGNQQADGVADRAAFANRLSQLEAVVQNQDNREHDILDSDDYYQFQGGMTNAVTTLSGEAPAVYHSDHSNPSQPKIRTLNEELNRVIRSRVLNPKWIEAMQGHGYKGAFEMAASVDYLFAYDATTDLVADYQYQQVSDALVFDEKNRDFLDANNPKALEEMAERLLEATQRGMWQDDAGYAEKLRHLLLELDESAEQADA